MPKPMLKAQPFSPPEADEQASVFQWAAVKSAAWPELKHMFHVPNGEQRDARTGARLKRMGVKRGVSDILLLVPRGEWHGLCVELKRRTGGRLSREQEEFLQFESAQGYRCAVAYGWEDAARIIEEYLKT